jgi:excisionase family DNA binding protein
MTTNEAADALGISPDTLRIQISNHRLHARKRGRDWWITDREVERYRAESLGRPGRPLGAKDRVPRRRSAGGPHGATPVVTSAASGSEII